LALFVFEFLFLVPYSFADTGNCASGSVAWGEKVGFISFYGAGGVGDYGVTISSSALTGYAWGAQTGWIHMGNAIPYSYGVVNTIVGGTGQLSGYAWGEKVGFISFASSTPDYSETPAAGKYGVWIDGSGVFHGYAWGAQTGWIHFNHTSYTYGVTTSWVPSHTVTFNSNGGSGSMSAQTNNVPTALTANSFTKTGYTFAHWDTIALGGGTIYADGASYSFSTDVTLYAQWTINSYTFTIGSGIKIGNGMEIK